MKKIIFILGFVFLSLSVTGQSWLSSNAIFGTGIVAEVSSSSDNFENLYILGFFTETVSAGSFELTTKGSRDYFLMKISSLGEVEWLNQLGGTSFEYVGGGIVVNEGFIYVTGGFQNDLYYTEADFISSSGMFDSFLAKYSTSGEVIWCKNVIQGGSHQRTSNINIYDGSLLISGFFTETAIIGQDTTLYSNDIFDDVFYSNFDLEGNHIWSKQIKYIYGVNQYQYPGITNFVFTDTHIYFSTIYADSVIIDLDTLVSYDNSYDSFLAKTDLEGNLEWVRKFGGNSVDYSYSLTKDNLDNIYVSGYYESPSMTVDSTEEDFSYINSNNGGFDFYVLKYSTEGILQWSRYGGSVGEDRFYSIEYRNEEIHIVGYSENTLNWGGIELVANNRDLFYGSLDLDGNYRSAQVFGSSGNEEGRSIFDVGESLYISFLSDSDALTIGDSTYLSSSGQFFMVVGALGCPQMESTVIPTGVTPYVGSQSGSIEVNVSGGNPGTYKYSVDNGNTYTINNPITGLGVGTYDVVILDNENCSKYYGEVEIIERFRVLTF